MKPTAQQILTANHLLSGDVVFRAADGEWVADVDRAEVLAGKDTIDVALQKGMADIDRCLVVAVEAIDVKVEDGHVVPLRLRERIRANGPTIKADHRADLRPF